MMGVYFQLVNYSKKERIGYSSVSGMKKFEILRHPVACAMTTYYSLMNAGDNISFIADEAEPTWPFPDGSPEDLAEYKDVTEEIISTLVKLDMVRDEGKVEPGKGVREISYVVHIPGLFQRPMA
jgi:hypothetical protein